MNYDPLVYGKDQTPGVVSLELTDSGVELFLQDSEGNITSEVRPYRPWILADKAYNKNFVKLKGNLHYCYGQQFENISEMRKQSYFYKKKDYDIYQIYNSKENVMAKDGISYFKGLEPKDLSVLSFDIETTGLDPNAPDAFVICISATYRDKKGTQKFFFNYNDFEENQGAMIYSFCALVRKMDPTIILGHNIIPYDLVYLQAIADRENVKLLLGRDGSSIKWETYKKKFRVDGNRDLEFNNCSIYGREIVDTYFMAQAFDVSRNMESYKLKPMIKQLGLESENRTYYDADKIRHNYKDPVEFEKIIAYCRDDSDDPIKLWDRMGSLYFYTAQMVPKSFQEIILGASGSKINSMLVRSYLQDAHSIPKTTEVRKYDGAISFAIPGIYSNCFKIDLAALYPSIMIEYEVFDIDKDPKGHLLQLVKTFRANRLEYKRLAKETGLQIWNDMDNAAKGILNSFYGFLGASGLNFNSLECVAFIAAKGAEILKYTIEYFGGISFDEFKKQHPESFDEEEVLE
jgi:DNA polymerase I